MERRAAACRKCHRQLFRPLHLAFWDKGTDGHAFMRYYDATNPDARRYIWDKIVDGYRRFGIRVFWLDACEPGDSRRQSRVRPLLPRERHGGARRLPTRERPRVLRRAAGADGEDEIVLLCRSAWAGSQRYGAAVWSGDIESTFEALAAQIPAGLNMGIAGIPWWTTDIGGFKNGGHPTTPYFREPRRPLVPVRHVLAHCSRLHGVREPGLLVGSAQTGAPNEVWSFGEEAYELIREQLLLRERIRPYVMEQMATASATGLPPMRALFLGRFPDEEPAWEIRDEYMFGPDVLVAPVTVHGARQREVYLPEGARRGATPGRSEAPGHGTSGWLTANAPPRAHPLVYLREGGKCAQSRSARVTWLTSRVASSSSPAGSSWPPRSPTCSLRSPSRSSST